MENPAATVQILQRACASLLLYQSVLDGFVGQAFLDLLQAIRYTDADGRGCLQAYGSYFQALAAQNQNWEDYLITQILRADNPLTRQAMQGEMAMPTALRAAAQHDLQALHRLYKCSSAHLSQWVQMAAHLSVASVVWYKEPTSGAPELPIRQRLEQSENWAEAIDDLWAYYHEFGTGIFAQYQALRYEKGKFFGVSHPDPITFSELVGYELQRDAIVKNTKFLLAGYPALHVLLYGSRGSGKSSLVKALLNEYSSSQLRLIEVAKSELQDLPQITEQLRGVPQKFIIFVDDLSFEADDDAFKALKVVLEGNVTARPQNVVVYATSNRRHLIREFFSDRPRPQNEEVHNWDTVQEKLSFSDRFGLTLTFEPADQQTYLTIVRHLAVVEGINISPEELEYQALQWATRHNGRSGRTARQFINFFRAERALEV